MAIVVVDGVLVVAGVAVGVVIGVATEVVVVVADVDVAGWVLAVDCLRYITLNVSLLDPINKASLVTT